MEIFAGFLLGLFGGLHCVGMCGPIAASLPIQNNDKMIIVYDRLKYNFGRVITYSIMGLILGIFGNQFHLLGLQHYVSIITGVILLVVFLFPIIWGKFEGKLYQINFFTYIKGQIQKRIKTKSHFVIGILNGFIPCGFVYIALIASLNLNHIYESVIFMIFFGIGTIPLLFASSFLPLIFKSSQKTMFYIRRYATVLIAILFIFKGLGLGIPYLSPKLEKNASAEIVNDCCNDY